MSDPAREINPEKALGDVDWRARRQAVDAFLQDGGKDSLALFVSKLRREHRDTGVLNSILEILISMAPESLPALIELTRDEDSEVRMYAGLALGDVGDHRSISALSALLRDADVNVQYHAIEALAKLKAAETVDDLTKIAESRNFFLAFPALDALAAIGDSRVAPRLMPLLEDDVLQAAAVGALAELGDENLVPALAALLEQPNVVPAVVQALTRLYERYAALYGEGEYVADLVRSNTTEAGVHNLVAVLNTVAGDTLRAAVRVLGWVENKSIIPELTRLLGSSEVRHEVIETLVRHGREVTIVLCEHLRSEDTDIRRAAVTALSRIGDPRSVPALLEILADRELTVEAAQALSRIGDLRAYEPLILLLGHDRAAVRQAAIGALNSLGHPRMAQDITKLLFHSNPYVRESAVRIAGYFGYPECAGQLLDRIHDVSENVRRAAVENLPHFQDDRIFETLLRAAHDESPKIRAAAAQSLGHLDNANMLPELLRALKDKEAWVRYHAARSLGRLASPEAIDALSFNVRNDEANHVRIAAADALGSIGGARVVSVLAPVADSEDHDLARAALKALGNVGHPDALLPISAALRSPDAARRADAVLAMAIRRDAASVETLEAVASGDKDPKVSETALAQLAAIATPASIESLIRLTADRALRDRTINALGRLGPAHIDSIGGGLADARPDVRRAAVDALSRIKHPHVSDLLDKALQDESAAVRLAAVLALSRSGGHGFERKFAHIVRNDSDPAVREAAGKALQR